jgi:hypothetical protein
MANTDKNFDQYFKERLTKHEEKPSQLAWERLESQLPKKDKGMWFPLMGIAATLLLFLAVGYVAWQTNLESETGLPLTSELTTKQDEVGSGILEEADTAAPDPIEESKAVIEEPEKAKSKPIKVPSKKATPTKQKITETPKELLAEVTIPENKVEEAIFETPEIILPELDVTEAIAQNNIEVEEEVMSYKITIKSNGIKEEPEKQGLIAGIENKVDKIGGLLNKVEQGFADLQDAKENLFVSNNTSRRERK